MSYARGFKHLGIAVGFGAFVLCAVGLLTLIERYMGVYTLLALMGIAMLVGVFLVGATTEEDG